MRLLLCFKLFILLFSTVTTSEITATLIGDYFENLIIKHVVVFGCWETYEAIKLSRLIMKRNCEVSYINIQENLDIKKILYVNYYKLGIVLNLDCSQSQSIFDQFSKQQLRHNESYYWLMSTVQNSIPEYFYHLPLNIASEMTLAMRNNDSYILYDVYNPSYRHGGKLNVTYMGNWTKKNGNKGGLNIVLTQYKYQRRGNLYGLTLNASIVINYNPVPDYWTYIHNPINPHVDTMHRYNYALILQMRDYYNFTINLKKGTTWGYLTNGSFNGIIGDMIKGIVDFGATPFQFKPERIDVCEFTVQTWPARAAIIFRHPKTNDLNNPFLKPFEIHVWYWVLIFSTVNWALLYLATKLEKMIIKESTPTLNTYLASETALITVAAVSQQGLGESPKLFSGRIIFLSILFWAFLLYQFYSASIVGSLLAKKPRWINTLKDLVESNLEIGIEDMAYNHDFFATTTDSIAQRLYQEKVAITKKRKKANFFPFEEGLEKLRRGGFAFQVDVASAYKLIDDTFTPEEICDLVEIQLFPTKHTATATAKHSPFKKMVTYGMRQIVEHGMAQRLRHIWMPRKPECPESHNSEPLPVTLTEFSPTLFLLSYGCIQSLIIMIGEKFTSQWRRHSFMINRIAFNNSDTTEASSPSQSVLDN
ncbi:ionotropic receptor 75a-like [Chelonus insularis]|uniref:ionotropic receptor 75a-like n=1 Tax=Chelonus insularis TaxID=460826 RepID=UPI00158E9930|nr:ionotropic receptor 75a-like [Chelonus insularis]